MRSLILFYLIVACTFLPSCADNTTNTVSDVDTNVVLIGNQKWAKTNLDVSQFRNGDVIQEARTNEEWISAYENQRPAWCYYSNDSRFGPKYGKLYNYYAVKDPRNIAPLGYRVANKNDWEVLIASLSSNGIAGYKIAGKKIKSNTTEWLQDGKGDNVSGFTAFPAGFRRDNGEFMYEGLFARWWSFEDNYLQLVYGVDSGSDEIYSFATTEYSQADGYSVRCIKE